MPQISKIVLTAGPETAALMQRVKAAFSRKGYAVFCVPAPVYSPYTADGLPQMYAQLRAALAAERHCMETAASADGQALVLCAAGAMELKALLPPEIYRAERARLPAGDVLLRDGYDAVFQLRSGDEAADLRRSSAWVGTPHFRIGSTAEDLLHELSFFLGDPEPLEIERKYLISRPADDWLEQNPLCGRADIVQTYVTDAAGREFRLRRRGLGQDFVYFKTFKQQLSPTCRTEVETRLSESEYNTLLHTTAGHREIRKTRWCLLSAGRYFEIDLYPFWADRAVMEIELTDENETVPLPPQIRVLEDVSADPRYRNSMLARSV